jgi:hypothetical protein
MEALETAVFGRLLKRDEKVLTLTDMGIHGCYPVDDIDDNLAQVIPEEIDMSKYQSVAFVNGKAFEEYRELRRCYSALVNGDLVNQEGFCTLMEERIMREYDPRFAEQIFWTYLLMENVYGAGFRKLKAIESRYGLDSILDYLEKQSFSRSQKAFAF